MADAPALPIRKRLRHREIPGGLRFVTFSCQRRLPLLGRAAIRDAFAAALILTRAQHRFELFAWVVLPTDLKATEIAKPISVARLGATLVPPAIRKFDDAGQQTGAWQWTGSGWQPL